MKKQITMRVAIFEAIKELPYFLGDRSVNTSCGSKAKMLGLLLEQIGLKVRLAQCMFKWKDLNLPCLILKQIPHEYASHVFLKVLIPESKKWVIVDPTWDSGLASYFKISNWDGLSDTSLAVKGSKLIYLKNKKGNFISCHEFNVRNFDSNEKITKMLNQWFAKIRKLN